MKAVPSFEYDLMYLKAGLEILEKYLLSKELFWSIGIHAPPGNPPYPQFTLGGLALAIKRMEITARSPAQKAEWERQNQHKNFLHSRWRTAWNKKAEAEFNARLKMWGDFLEEYILAPEQNFDRYPYEVGRRVMLQLLGEEIDVLPQEKGEILVKLDKLLKSLLKPGEFIWDGELQPGFPRETYWYLYGRLPEKQEYNTPSEKL